MISAADYFFQVGWRLAVGMLFLTIVVYLAGMVRRMIRGWKTMQVEPDVMDPELLQFVRFARDRQLQTAKETIEELEQLLRDRGYVSGARATN